MQPIHVTGNPNVDWIIVAVGAVVCLYWLRALRLAREGARRFLRNLIRSIVLFFALTLVLTAARSRIHLRQGQPQFIAGFTSFLVFVRWQNKKRSRYIPKATRRAVIARDLKGEDYDPQKHHIDHVWPFSRGGSHTVDNLRVIEKKKNLRKGAKRPRIREMW